MYIIYIPVSKMGIEKIILGLSRLEWQRPYHVLCDPNFAIAPARWQLWKSQSYSLDVDTCGDNVSQRHSEAADSAQIHVI